MLCAFSQPLAVFCLLALLGCSEPPGTWVVPSGREARAIELLGDIGFERAFADGTTFDSIAIGRDRVVYALRRVGSVDAAPPLGRLTVRALALAQPGDRKGATLAIAVETLDPAPHVRARLEAGSQSLLRRDRPEATPLFVHVPAAGHTALTPVWQALGAALLAWALALGVHLTLRRTWPAVRLRFQPTHLLPAVLQSTLLGWWALHVPPVAAQFPRIGAQLLFAYGLDFLLAMTLRKRWDLSFAPVPVVLSANLFVWFPADNALDFAVVALALGAKWLVQWDTRALASDRPVVTLQPRGRHVFNPSAFGVAAVGVLCLAAPSLGHFEDISHLLAQPPHMVLVVLAAALVAQVRLPIVLIPLAACAVLLGLKQVGAYHVVYPFWPAVLLATTLLATDPATIPRTGPGRLLFGLGYGLAVWAVSAALTWQGESDFYGKVLPLPLLNLLAPQFDSLGAKLGRLQAWLAPRWNWAHLTAWLGFAAWCLH